MEKISIIELSNTYEGMDYKNKYPNANWVDCSTIQGTNCYLDDEAKVKLKDNLNSCDLAGIHLIGSGNYHYVSLFFLERIKEPFELLMFDHHPDMQQPGFGDITSCGGWLLEALNTLENLKRVYLIGVDEKLFLELGLEGSIKEKLIVISKQELRKYMIEDGIGDSASIIKDIKMQALKLPRNHTAIQSCNSYQNDAFLPIYISIDKDVLSPDYAITDWDQGDMNIDELIKIIDLFNDRKIIGVDICGDSKEKEDDGTNAAINEMLISYF